jgi:diacylglycerol kinase (ATP)
MQDDINRKENFSVGKRAKSFAHAGRGVFLFIKDSHNAWIHLCLFALAIFLGIYFQISSVEWMMIVLASGFVFGAEAFNTAIEIDMNLTSPEFHPFARDTKDVAAGAVLISAVAALVTGLIIFWPYIVSLLT